MKDISTKSIITVKELEENGYKYGFEKENNPVYIKDYDRLMYKIIDGNKLELIKHYKGSFKKVIFGPNHPIYSEPPKIIIGGPLSRKKK